MADDFTDFAASLDASIQHAEKRSKEVDAERLGIDPKEAETQEEPEEATPEEVPAGDEIDESYNDHVEFPDLSQIPHPDDVDETDEDEVAEEAEEETEDEDDEEGSTEERGAPFDLEATLAEIAGLKTSDLRKQFLRAKAEKTSLEQEITVAKATATKAEEETNRLRQEYLDKQTAPPQTELNDYEPYKEVLQDYQSWRERAMRRIKSGDARNKLASDETSLRAEGARIETLPASEYDAAREKLEKMVSSRYGAHAPEVMRLVDEASEFEVKAMKITQEFKDSSQEKASTWARESYEKRAKGLYDTVVSNYAVTPEQVAENPFSMQAFVHRLLNDGKEGERAHKIFKSDVDLLNKTLQGPPPLKVDPAWSDVERIEAQKLHADQSAKYAEHREKTLPTLAQDGLWARRVVPMLMKELSELRGLKKKVKPTPSPKRPGKAKPRGKMTPDAEREHARAELDKSLSLLG